MSDPDFPDNVSELRYPGEGEVSRIKMQPHSVEAEQSVLGGLLLSAEGWDAIAEEVVANDFYRPGHRLIFRQITKLADRSPGICLKKGFNFRPFCRHLGVGFRLLIPDPGLRCP